MKNQIKLGVIINYCTIFLNIVSGLLYTPWMIGKIGQVNYGLFTLAYSLINILSMDFGMNSAVSKFISDFLAKKENEKINDFLGLVYKIYFLIDILILIVGTVIYFNLHIIYTKFTPEELKIFKKLFVMVFVFTLISFPLSNFNGIINSHERFIELKTCDFFNKLLTILFMIILLCKGYGVFSLVFVNILIGSLTFAAKGIIIKKTTKVKINYKFYDSSVLKNIFSFTIWSTIVSLCIKLMHTLVPNVLAIVNNGGVVYVSIFNLGNTLADFVYYFSIALNGFFMPTIARINILPNKNEEINKLLIKVGRLMFISVGYIVTLFIVFGKDFIVYIWHRPEFADSYFCAIILMIPNVFIYSLLILNTLFIVDNKIHIQANIYWITCLFNLCLSVPLCKYYGYIGASCSILTALSVRVCLVMFFGKKTENINICAYSKEVFLKILPYHLFIIAVGLLLNKYNVFSNHYYTFVINILILSVIFIFIMFIFGFNKYEKDLFLKPLLKIFMVKNEE